MQRWAKRVVGLVVTAGFMVSACGGGSEGQDDGADPDPAGPSVTIGDPGGGIGLPGGVDIDDGAGNSAQIGSELPDDLPDEVVIPTGYTPQTVNEQELEGQTSYIIVGSATADSAQVAAEIEGDYEVEPQRTDAGGVVALKYDIDGLGVEYTLQDNADGVAVVTIGVFPPLG